MLHPGRLAQSGSRAKYGDKGRPGAGRMSGFALKLCPISLLTLPSHYGKSVVFPCVRLRVVALATTRAIHIFNVELL